MHAVPGLAVPEEQIRLASESVDQFIVDCKDLNPDTYSRYTGGDEGVMESNLRLLLDLVGPERVRVRVPRIPDYDTPEDQARSAEKLRALGVRNLDLFTYVKR